MGPDLSKQIHADLTAFQYKNKPLFRVVELAAGDTDDLNHFKETPHVQIKQGTKDSDEFEPVLGERKFRLKIYFRDHSGGNDGTETQASDALRADYGFISEYLNDNYNYKAGGVYNSYFALDDISELEPEGEGLFSCEALYTTLIG